MVKKMMCSSASFSIFHLFCFFFLLNSSGGKCIKCSSTQGGVTNSTLIPEFLPEPPPAPVGPTPSADAAAWRCSSARTLKECSGRAVTRGRAPFSQVATVPSPAPNAPCTVISSSLSKGSDALPGTWPPSAATAVERHHVPVTHGCQKRPYSFHRSPGAASVRPP